MIEIDEKQIEDAESLVFLTIQSETIWVSLNTFSCICTLWKGTQSSICHHQINKMPRLPRAAQQIFRLFCFRLPLLWSVG